MTIRTLDEDRAHDRGSVALETVIVFPVMLLLTFGLVQGALFYFARDVALAAAQEGARASSAQSGSASAGIAVAAGFVNRVGGVDLLQSSRISAARGLTATTVTVTGRSLSIIPGWGGLAISQSASLPVERITG